MRTRRPQIIDIDGDNVCDHGFCGYKSLRQEGYRRKTEWLKKRFREGMQFRVLQDPSDGSVGMIEYIPGEYTWRPVEAPGYLVIHCLMIQRKKYKGKGYGTLLLERCLHDAERAKSYGVAVVTSGGTWMAGRDLFVKHGFESVDSAPPSYELLVKRLRRGPRPKFTRGWEKQLRRYGAGLVVLRSDQCPCVHKFTTEIMETCERLGLGARVIELGDCRQARRAPSAYGVFNIIHEGKLLAEHPISKTRFTNIVKRLL